MNITKHNTTLLILLLGLLSFTTSLYAQDAYVKFLEQPSKKLNKDLSNTLFHIEYKSKKEATIYIELLKKGKSLANVIRTVKSRKPKTLKLKIKKFAKAKLMSGTGYTIKLSMFQGPPHNWDRMLGDVTVIDGVKISRIY